MKHVIIIVPSMNCGGVTSSLITLYSKLQLYYNIDVFPLTRSSADVSMFDGHVLNGGFFLDSYYGNFSSMKLGNRFSAFFVKALKRIFPRFSTLLLRCSISQELFKNYDMVIAYQEGYSTEYAQYIDSDKKIAWVHCDYKRAYPQCKELQIYEKFNKIVCVSEYTTATFKECYPQLSGRVYTIYNFFDAERVTKLSKETVVDPCFVVHERTLVTIGRLDPIKRVHLIPLVAKKLKQSGLDFCWYIIGPSIIDDYTERIKKEIQSNDVSDVVRLLSETSNPYFYMRKAALLVSLSESEACPMIFNEAKSLNLPIISAFFGGVEEFVTLDIGQYCDIDSLPDKILTFFKEQKKYAYDYTKLHSYNNELIKKVQLLLE